MKKRSFIARSVAIVLGITLGFGTLPSNTFKSEPVKAAEVTDITGLTTVETVGDINGDGEINAKDVTMLRRYLAGGWGVTVNEEDADINVDGEVNAKDVTMLRRYLAGGWGVELIGKTSKTVPKPYQITEPIKVEKHWEIEFDNENFVFPKYDEITGLLTEVAHIDVIGVVDSVTYSYYETGIIKSISRIYNINRDTVLNGGNQTIETEYYDENGIKTGTEYRYIPGPESPNTEQKYGSTKKITYNDNIVSIIEENTDGDITRINEEYDKNGNIILETWNCSDGRTFTERYEYEYYDSGVIKKIKKIFPELNTFETYYDEYGRENGYGGVRTDGSVFEENYKYDIEGRIISIIGRDENRSYNYTYEYGANNIVIMKDQFFDIELDFDEKELCLKEIYIENDCTKSEHMYWYDKEWHLIKVKDVYSDGIERIVEYVYNEERNLILEKVDSDGVETKIEYEYDRNGKRSEIEHSMAE